MFLLFQIINPFYKNSKFKIYFCFTKQILKNKFFEIQLSKYNRYLFELEMDFQLTGKDHAGIKFSLTLFEYELSLLMYDNRHWDYENRRWQEYE
jgi:hypothetical protein